MSIESNFRIAILGGGLFLLALSPAQAQRTTFRPALVLQEAYTDNVRFVGDDASDASDTVTRFSLELPVERRLRTGMLTFSYTPSFERYADFGDLDNDSHVVALGLRSAPSRTSEFQLDLSFARTQAQGDPTSIDDADLFLDRRTDRDLLRGRVGYSNRLSDRWGWRGGVSFSDTRFDAIQGFDDTGVEDRKEYGGELGFDRALSSATSIGAGVAWQRFDLDIEGEETVQSVVLTLRRTLGRRYALDASIGGFLGKGDAVEAAQLDDDERSGGVASLTLTRTMRRWALGLSAMHAPSSGGAVQGISTNSAVGLNLNGNPAPAWSWGASARVARRDPVASSEGNRTSYAVGGNVERRFGRILGIRFGGDYVDQTDGSDQAEFDSSYYGVQLGIVWYPLGWTKLGGQGEGT